MNYTVLRLPEFWSLAKQVDAEGGAGHAGPVLADWLEEHGSPIRAHIFRHGAPVVPGPEGTQQVTFRDGDGPHPITGVWHDIDNPDAHLADHFPTPAESMHLYTAGGRHVVRYTLRLPKGRSVTLAAPVGSHELRAIGDDWERQWKANNPHSPQTPWNHWHQYAQHAEWAERGTTKEPARLARITIGPGTPNGQPFGGGGPISEHPIHDERGQHIGHLRIRPIGNGTILHVHWVGLSDAHPEDDANRLGASAIRDVIPQISAHYPDAHLIRGARGSSGLSATGFRSASNQSLVYFPLTEEGRSALRDMKGRPPKPTKLARPRGQSNPQIMESARAYHEKYGKTLGLKPFDPTPSRLTITPEHSKQIVDAYEARKHNPDDQDVKAAYDAFKRETLQQYQHAVAHGLKVMRWEKPGQPYENSQAMRDHVDKDHAIYYFPTASGYEPQDAASHPPLEQVPGMPPGVLYNDLFRAVHEYYAHAMHGHEFGPLGELRAWHEHAKMYSPLARRALTNETLGQTQWFFHGPHKDKPVPQRPFPEQRAALLPDHVEPTPLARMKAPAQGTIVNNQFQKGGQFIAKVRQRIRDVAPKLAKLARPEGTSNFIEAIHANPEEPLGHLTFADWLQEHGMPGAHVVRAHAAALHGGDTVSDRSVSGGVMDPNLLLLGPTSRIVKTGSTTYSKIKKDEFRERPLAQLSWGGGMARIAMAHKADTTARGTIMDGRPVIHFANASTPEELEHLISDWPAWAQKYARNTAGAHLRATQDPTKLARKDEPLAPVDLSAHGLVGRPVGDKPLTLGQLKAVEDRYGLKDKERLSNAPSMEATTDDQPYTVKVDHIKKFIETISKKAMPTRRHLRILADPKVSDGEKLTHLVAQIGKDYAGAEHPPEGESWYGGQVSHLDRMLHNVAAKGKPHPLWGTLDPKTGELVGKDDPATNHPGLVLMKAIIAATSGSQNPRDNLSSAVRAWAAGRRAGHPITNLPEYNHEALSEWIDKVKRLHGKLTDPTFDADLRRPGTTPEELGAWFARFVTPHRKELEASAPGYAQMQGRVIPATGKVIETEKHGKVNREQPGAINALLPYTNEEGMLKPKGWGARGKQVAERLSLIKAVFKHFADQNPEGTELAHMRATADWLVRDHAPVAFDAMSKAIEKYKAQLPHLKPHYIKSEAIFKKGFTDEDNPELPGMFILGPKFGSFAMNLHSNDPRVAEKNRRFLTADMWWTRNFMRYLGRMKESPGVNDRRQMLKAVQAVTKKLGITPADLQADLWYHEQGLYRMLGADADHVESLSYRDAANDLLDPKSPKALRQRDGKMVKLARTVPHDDPELQTFVRQLRGSSGNYDIDHTSAKVLGDWLEEHDDWRHWLMRRTQHYTPYEGRTSVDDPHRLSDGTNTTEYNYSTTRTAPTVYHGDDETNGALSEVRPAKDLATGQPRVYVRSLYPAPEPNFAGRRVEIHSVLTPEEYEQMRKDAATAGVKFPKRAPK